jgi:hypothetical protein
LSFNTSISLANLTLNSGTVTGTLTITSAFNWTASSTMSGSGAITISNGATLAISGGGGDKVLDFRTLNLADTGTWSGASNWNLEDGAVFNVKGPFSITNDQTLQNIGGQGNAAINVNNAGTITKTSPSGSGTTVVNAVFNSSGIVTVTTGVLDINDGGADTSPT